MGAGLCRACHIPRVGWTKQSLLPMNECRMLPSMCDERIEPVTLLFSGCPLFSFVLVPSACRESILEYLAWLVAHIVCREAHAAQECHPYFGGDRSCFLLLFWCRAPVETAFLYADIVISILGVL
jgi:hypothetical protein